MYVRSQLYVTLPNVPLANTLVIHRGGALTTGTQFGTTRCFASVLRSDPIDLPINLARKTPFNGP